MSQSIEAMRSAIQNVRVLTPTLPHAARLARFYNQAYLDDETLLAKVCHPSDGIDGLTETQSEQRLLGYMKMADTITLEHRIPGNDDCGGFIITRWATSSPDSLAGFRSYFLGDVFMPDQLRFDSNDVAAKFHSVMEQGNVVYIVEIASSGGPGITLALIAAAYLHVKGQLKTDDFEILGKCLHSARIGQCVNELGNRPIRAFVGAMGLRPIGHGTQRRQLAFATRPPLFDQAFPAGTPAEIVAQLEFGLYLGNSSTVAQFASGLDRV